MFGYAGGLQSDQHYQGGEDGRLLGSRRCGIALFNARRLLQAAMKLLNVPARLKVAGELRLRRQRQIVGCPVRQVAVCGNSRTNQSVSTGFQPDFSDRFIGQL